MAVLHRSWIWNPEEAHRAIAAAVVEEGVVSTDALRQAARLAAESGSEEYLHMITFDYSLLDEEIPDEPFLYVVALGRFLKQTEGIKLPLTLQGVLRDLGWPNTESDRLIFGDPLTTLPDSLNDPLMNLIRPDLTLSRPFGGWLSSTRGADLLVKLNDCAPHFLDSKRNSFLSRHSSKESGLGPKQAIEMYRSALTMLERLQSLPTGYVLRCIAP